MTDHPSPKPDAPEPDAPEPDAPGPDASEPDAPGPDAPSGGGLPPAAYPGGDGRRTVAMPVAVPVTVALVLGLTLGVILGWVLPRPGDGDSVAVADVRPPATAAAPATPAAAPTLDPAAPPSVPGGPDGTEELGGLVLGTQGPVVELFEDYVCPFCARLEQSAGASLRESAENGEFRLVLHPIAFLTEDSPRAANASACVYQHAEEETWVAFHEAIYATQDPSESEGQFATPVLLDLAVDVGADSPEVTACIEDGTYTDWVAALTQSAFSRGVTGTPTVAVDGTVTDVSPLLQ
jgi:protein-disulfide isomerase